jgi:hypothetical protein
MHLFARRPRGVAPPFANAPPLRAAPDIDSDGAPQILGFVCRPGPGLASCCPGWPGGPGVGTLETPGCAGCARRVYSGVSSSTNGPTTEAPRRAAECARSFVMPRGRAPEGAALSGNHEHVSVAHPQTADVLLAVPFALIGLALVRSGVRSPGSSSSGERHSGPTSRRSDEHGRGLHRSNRRVLPAAGRPCGGVLLAPGRYALVLGAGETRDPVSWCGPSASPSATTAGSTECACSRSAILSRLPRHIWSSVARLVASTATTRPQKTKHATERRGWVTELGERGQDHLGAAEQRQRCPSSPSPVTSASQELRRRRHVVVRSLGDR